jgi:TorA maturation chaperone TorD
MERSDDIALRDAIESRWVEYALLARGYREEPSLELLRTLAAAGAESGVDEPFLRALAAVDDLRLESMQADLATEYAALFVNASTRAIHPFESVYTSPDRLVMQQARDDVLREYREAGLERARGFSEPEDHIALECEFMSYLCRKAFEAMGKGDKAETRALLHRQHAFVCRHLAAWVPQLCAELTAATGSAFYLWLAKRTADLVQSEPHVIPQLITACE